AAGQFPRLVDLVYNSTRLPDLESPGADTRSRLESILRSGLSSLDVYELNPPELAATKSRAAAESLLAHLNHEIQSAESAYTFSPVRATALSPTHIALSGLTPPSRVTKTTHSSSIHRPSHATAELSR